MQHRLRRHRLGSLSFSQSGEDVLVARLLRRLGVSTPTYLDIGANHPWRLNNTALLYIEGYRGVLIEPHPDHYRTLCKRRPGDRVVHAGIGAAAAASADFFVMSNPYLHTFSLEEAQAICAEGRAEMIETLQLPILSINEAIASHFDQAPNFVSLDTEGLDEQILESFDFSRCRPEVFCVEAVAYYDHQDNRSNDAIGDRLLDQGYLCYADVHINRVYVDEQKWKQRHNPTP